MNVAIPDERHAGGRPSRARKNDVDARLLSAATQLFLKQGFEGTSCDQVAQTARAGKASIYARYANKTALFAAVIQTNLEHLFDAPHVDVDAATPVRQRMVAAGRQVVHHALQADAVALLRLVVAEAPRLDSDAVNAAAILQKIGVKHVARAIAALDDATGNAEAVEAVEAAAIPAAALLDLILMPVLLRALLGADLDRLRVTALAQVPASVDLLMASDVLQDGR